MNPLIPLLAEGSACLRYRVLAELLRVPSDDPELAELDALRALSPETAAILAAMNEDGSIGEPGSVSKSTGSKLRSTAFALSRLGFLGFDSSFPAVARAAAYLFSLQEADGSWPLSAFGDTADERKGAYDMIPLQTAVPLRGLAMTGYAEDPRAEKSFEWLLSKRLPDGAWPAGTAKGDYGFIAGYRRIAHSRFGCRSNTTGAALCFSYHPGRRKSEAVRRALDLLLGRETRERINLGYEAARLSGYERFGGFFTLFARFDPALILGLCARSELSADDPRLASLAEFVRGCGGERGLWETPGTPGAEAWIAFDIRLSLTLIDGGSGAWTGTEPETPFSPYPARRRRY